MFHNLTPSVKLYLLHTQFLDFTTLVSLTSVFHGYVPLGPMPVLPILFLAPIIRQPASKKSGWLSIRLAPPRCSTSLRFGWTPLDCAAQPGARSKHGSRQTKTKPVWHDPRRHFAPCHPALCCVSPFALRAGRFVPLRVK